MKYLSEADIVAKVRINLDEIGLNDSNFSGSQDEAELDKIIKDKIEEGLRYVHGNADPALLEMGTPATPTATPKAIVQGSSVKVVEFSYDTDKWLRVIAVKESTWKRAVSASEFVYEFDPELSALSDPLVTGSASRPKVVVQSDGKKMYCYTTTAASPSVTVYYVPVPAMDTSGTNKDKYGIARKLEFALYYYITGLVLLVLRDNHADAMFHQAIVHMGLSEATTNNK